MRPGETSRCKCGMAIIGAQTKAGKVAPICVNPSDDGNVLLFRGADGIEARTFAGATLDKLRADGVPLRLSHFADCPNAAEFKRGAAA